MNDKEIIKKLAEGIKDTYISHHSECCIHCNIYDDDGTFIRDNFGFYHNLDCPVLLAEEILKSETPFQDALDELQTDIAKSKPSKERFCPSCGGQETIDPVKGTEPYSEDYLMCNKCDSTFNKDEVIKEHFKRIYALAQEYKEEFLHAINYEQYNLSSKADNPQFTEEQALDICKVLFGSLSEYDDLIRKLKKYDYIIPSKPGEPFSKEHMKEMCKSRVDLEKKPMKLYELQHYVDKLIAQGYSDVPVYFDTEAKSYDCHIVPIGSINIVPKEAVGEDHIVLYEYIEKPEEPIIVHNVMSYKGKNYLKQLSLQWDPSNIDSCKFCSFNEDCPLIDMACEDNFIWKSFDDIRITDELACMRKDIGDIYVFNIQEDQIDKLVYVENDSDMYVHTLRWRSTNDNMRLATAEEIQKYLEMKP